MFFWLNWGIFEGSEGKNVFDLWGSYEIIVFQNI